MAAAIYVKNISNEQLADLRAWVTSQGFQEILEYRETSAMKARTRDKELGRLIDDAKKHKFTHLFVVSLANVGFDQPNIFMLMKVTLGIKLISQAEPWTDMSDKEFGFMCWAYFEHGDSDMEEMFNRPRSTKTRYNRYKKKDPPKE